MGKPQLRLVEDSAPGFHAAPTDAVRSIFEHWVLMCGKTIRRCKLGPTRRQAINAGLAMEYSVEELMLAVEGHAADPMDWARDEEMREACRDLDWLMAREKRIEAAIKRGEDLRRRAGEPEAEVVACEPAPPTPEQLAEAAEFRQRLAAAAAKMRAGRG